ncbi:PhnD/SsuA/transferrin family substrate-binding protein [Erysipelothrix urinaevulpis]|uniref:PhnD/SsuA/transferrin family substrate-binding protein n=1 Tax=Erysipelothrix urinaevulpis TaxID=2683717 RepID=UPI00135C2976|nr:PhnD/SsuA/transferrin family substrate-binding protein [Erysipelothrix urinaevulpis]
MKKYFIALVVMLLFLAGCSAKGNETSSKEFDEITVFFVPSRDPKEVETKTEPLKQLIIDEMKKEGYTIGAVNIEVSPTYESAGEALDAGKAHIGFIPASTYALYSADKNVDVILAAARDGLNKDSVEAKDWNDGEPTLPVEEQVTYYRSLIYAGTSPKGRELAEIVNSGKELTWENLNGATWCHSNTTSSAGYVQPSVWLAERFDGKMIENLDNKIEVTGYPDTAARLATGQCDVGVGYADIRRDYEKNWTDEWSKENIWKETDIIGVTDKIMNDTISVSNKLVDADMKVALQKAFKEIAKTESGKEAISIYNHTGYQEVTDADYDPSRKVLEALKDRQ